GNVLGGPTYNGSTNLISGNRAAGVEVVAGADNVIQGNRIGTNAAGTAAVPNAVGVRIDATAASHTLGGTAAAVGNVISGNTGAGVLLENAADAVYGNAIGTDPATTQAVGNGTGILIQGSNHTVGGTEPAANNVISGNRGAGVEVAGG